MVLVGQRCIGMCDFYMLVNLIRVRFMVGIFTLVLSLGSSCISAFSFDASDVVLNSLLQGVVCLDCKGCEEFVVDSGTELFDRGLVLAVFVEKLYHRIGVVITEKIDSLLERIDELKSVLGRPVAVGAVMVHFRHVVLGLLGDVGFGVLVG